MSSQSTAATTALNRAGIHYVAHPYTAPQSGENYGAQAAAALGIEEVRMFKTLVVDIDGALHIAVVPVSGQLDPKAMAGAVGGKRAKLAESAAASKATGYVIGGIAPLGHRKHLRVTIDESALGFDTIYCSAGRRGLAIELSPADLVAVTEANTAPLTR